MSSIADRGMLAIDASAGTPDVPAHARNRRASCCSIESNSICGNRLDSRACIARGEIVLPSMQHPPRSRPGLCSFCELITMVLLEMSITPLGQGESVSAFVAECVDIIDRSGLDYELHAMG